MVEVGVSGNALLFQGAAHSLVAGAFVDAIFVVEMHGLYPMFLTQLQQGLGYLLPGIGATDQ
ncbi:hypothetical protein D3C77_627830 [compost metagenome]